MPGLCYLRHIVILLTLWVCRLLGELAVKSWIVHSELSGWSHGVGDSLPGSLKKTNN